MAALAPQLVFVQAVGCPPRPWRLMWIVFVHGLVAQRSSTPHLRRPCSPPPPPSCNTFSPLHAAPRWYSYLIEERILDAMKTTGAEAVHPGYGFLSENAEFSEAVDAMGAAFIGPGAEAIRLMGIKDVSMDIAQQAGVSTATRYTKGDVDTPEHALEVARGLGYPVIMKAVKGGGGKGMRVAWSEEDLVDGFNSARSEAMNAFGDDKILFQQFVCVSAFT